MLCVNAKEFSLLWSLHARLSAGGLQVISKVVTTTTDMQKVPSGIGNLLISPSVYQRRPHGRTTLDIPVLLDPGTSVSGFFVACEI